MRNILKILILAMLLSAAQSCAPKNDPVAELTGIIQCRKDAWPFLSKKETDPSFDVRKSDSLVSPVIGTVAYSSDPDWKWELTLQYVDKRWRLESLRYRITRPFLDRGWEEAKSELRDNEYWDPAIKRYYKNRDK